MDSKNGIKIKTRSHFRVVKFIIEYRILNLSSNSKKTSL